MSKKKFQKKATKPASKLEEVDLTEDGLPNVAPEAPKPAKAAVEKKPKPAPKTKKEKPKLSIAEIMTGVKDFKAEVMEDDKSDFDFPYRIPFRHKGLQFITGGIIGGKMAEINGESQTGKSYLGYELIASTQEMGGYALLYDAERAYEKAYAKASGINLKSGTFAIDPNLSMEHFFSNSVTFIQRVRKVNKTCPILIVCDSYVPLTREVDLTAMKAGENAKGYAAMQKNAYFSQQIDKFLALLDDNDATFVLMNQVRKDHKIEYGDKTISPAEDIIKFRCTQRIRGKLSKKLVKKVKSLEYKSGDKVVIGATTIWTCIKNRSVLPFQKSFVRFSYSGGLETYSGLDNLLYGRGVIAPATTTIGADGTKLEKSRSGFKVAGDETQAFYETMRELVDANPQLIEPIWAGTTDDKDGDLEVEEDDVE